MYKRILIFVDERPVSRAAVKEGIALAEAHEADIVWFWLSTRDLMPVADVASIGMFAPIEFEEVSRRIVERRLAAGVAVATRKGIRFEIATHTGAATGQRIVDAARQYDCDVIVVASEGRSALIRLVSGSVIPTLISESPMPVLVCKQAVRTPARVSGQAALSVSRNREQRPVEARAVH